MLGFTRFIICLKRNEEERNSVLYISKFMGRMTNHFNVYNTRLQRHWLRRFFKYFWMLVVSELEVGNMEVLESAFLHSLFVKENLSVREARLNLLNVRIIKWIIVCFLVYYFGFNLFLFLNVKFSVMSVFLILELYFYVKTIFPRMKFLLYMCIRNFYLSLHLFTYQDE